MAKKKIIWSPLAKLDLFEILDFFYKRNGTITYSRRLNTKIRKSIRLLEKYPDVGTQTDISNIRSLVCGDYRIFYEVKSDTIILISIWDCRQDPDKIPLSE